MKRKLDDEVYQALLNVFNGQTSGFRKVANQSLKFKVAFHFVNIYAVSMMLVYFITANFLLDHINPEFVQHQYLDLLGKRAFVFFWLLGAFNMAFYFGIGFRFTVGVMLLYTINATFEQFFVIHSNFGIFETPVFSAYALSRPVFMLALLGLLLFYKNE